MSRVGELSTQVVVQSQPAYTGWVGELHKYIGLTCGPLILQVIQSRQPGPIDLASKLQPRIFRSMKSI